MAGQTPGQIVLSVIGGVIGGYLGGYSGAMIGASLGGMVGRMIDPPDAPKPPPLGDVTINTYNRNTPLAVVYGQCKVAGAVIMRDNGVMGWDKDGGGKGEDPVYTIKMTLCWAVAHCEGPIEGYATPNRHWIDDKVFTGSNSNSSVWQFVLYTGTQPQGVDGYFNSFYSGQVPPPPLIFTAYTRVWAHVHGSTFGAIPNFATEIRGFLCQAGEYDANPIRVAFDWMTNERYAVGMPLDAFNGAPDTVDTPWKVASDYCDALVNYTDRNGNNASEPRFRYSNEVSDAIKGYDFLSDLMNSCRGILRYKLGKIEPLIETGEMVPEFYYSDRVKVAFVTGGGTNTSRIYADFSAYPLIYWRGSIGRITINGEDIEFGIKDQTATYIDLCMDLPSDPGAGVNFTITKDNIKEGTFNFKELADNSLPNVIRVEFQRRQVWDVNAGAYVNEYQWDSIEQEVPELYTFQDNSMKQNLKKIKTIRYSGVKRPTQAMRMSQWLADQTYYARWFCQFTTGVEGYQHAVGDVVGITNIQAAWSNKWFKIIKMEELDSDEIQLDFLEYNPNVYGDNVNVQDFDPNYNDNGGSSWTVPPQVERFTVVQDLTVLGQYKFYLFFKRPENSNFWYGVRVYQSIPFEDRYYDSFSVTTPSVKLSGNITAVQTTIPFDSTTLYGAFPTSGSFYIRSELVTYTGISGNTFTGCTRAVNGVSLAQTVNEFCQLLQVETPYILTTNEFVGTEVLFKAVSFVASGIAAPIDTAPTYPVFVQANDPLNNPGNEGGQ